MTHLSDDPLAAAQALAAEIATRSPDAVRGMKRLFDESWTGSAEETLRLEANIQLGLLGTPNQLEAVRAGMLKEPASSPIRADRPPSAGAEHPPTANPTQ